MTLKSQLDDCRSAFQTNAADNLRADMHQSLIALRQSGALSRAAKAGDIAPTFRLSDAEGHQVQLANLLRRGPVVLSFLWCEWCPFCVLEIAALGEAKSEMERLGATIVALTPHLCEGTPSSSAPKSPTIRILRDVGGEVAKRYGVAFRVHDDSRAAYSAMGYPQGHVDRADAWLLPIPATYIVDTDGSIVLSYLDTDYTTRLEPAEIIVALERLRSRRTLSHNPNMQNERLVI